MKTVPDVLFESTGDVKSFKALRGKNIVLYFYPKDDTPGCTTEGIEFTAKNKSFLKHNTVVIGVSRDDLKSHAKFCDNHALTLPLISDTDEILCKAFGVMKEKNMYGKKVRGIDRSTFLINTKGELVREWRSVKVDGHVDEVLAAVKDL